MRSAHAWKIAGPASGPGEIIVFDCETWHGSEARVPTGEFQRFRLGCALAYRLEKCVRTRQESHIFFTPGDFWRLVESRLNASRPVYVFAHNTAYDLGCVSGWKKIMGGEYECDTAIITQTMCHFEGRWKGLPLRFSDLGNYYHCKLESVGKAVGIQKMSMPAQEESDAKWVDYCRNDVAIAAAGLDALIEFNRTNELGPWAPSIAGLSFNAYRHRFMPRKVHVHDWWEDIRVERGSYFGGIVDTPFIGRVPFERVHELDVNSMYASQCLRPLPFERVSHSFRCGTETIMATPRNECVIAEVTIDSDKLRFPIRTRIGAVYPTGKYVTCLAWPELRQAIKAGAVKWVHQAVWYRTAPILREYMEFFSALKIKYHTEENDAFETLAKYFLTNLYGKTGQRSPQWKRWGPQALQEVEMQYGMKPGALECTYNRPPKCLCTCPERFERFGNLCDECGGQVMGIEPEMWRSCEDTFHWVRNWFGFLEIQGEEYESRDSFPAIAATVTSYARVFLRRLQAIAGDGHWCYSDTDSIWVDDMGLSRLRDGGHIREGTIGKLSYKRCHDWMVVHGPKDYVTPDRIKLKGIKPMHRDYLQPGDVFIPMQIGNEDHGMIRTPDGEYRQIAFAGASAQIKRGKLDGVPVDYVTKALARTATKCVVLPSGWTRPLKFPGEAP